MNKLSLKFSKIAKILLWVIVVAVSVHIVLQVIAYILKTDNRVFNDVVNRFGLDEELSFPTWVNSMLAFIVAGLAWLVGKHQTIRVKQHAWYLIAWGGLLVSVDEVAALHELILQGLHILANFGEGSQSLTANAWLLVLPVVLIVLFFASKTLYKGLPKSTFKNMLFGVGVYILGAVVVEYLSIPFDKSLLIYNIGMVVIEEALEMIGVWLIIIAILKHIQLHEKMLNEKLKTLF